MTDPTDRDTGPPDDPEQAELVSAVLDGLASPAEVDRVMGDPALHEQLEAYRAVSGALARPAEPLTGPTVDHLVGRALEEFDLADADADTEAGGGEQVPLNWTGELPTWSDHEGPGRVPAERRGTPGHDRRPAHVRRRRIPPIAVAAGLVLLAGLGLFLALSARSGNHPDAGSTATGARGSSGDKAAGGARRNAAPPTSSPGGGTVGQHPPAGVAEADVRFLGNFAGDSDLSTALSKLNPRTLEGPTVGTPDAKPYVPSAAEIKRCDPVVRGHISRALTNRLAVAGATSATRDLIVFSYEAPATNGQPPGVLIIAASRISCYPMLSQFH